MTERNSAHYVLISLFVCLISMCSCGVKPQLEPVSEVAHTPSLMDITTGRCVTSAANKGRRRRACAY